MRPPHHFLRPWLLSFALAAPIFLSVYVWDEPAHADPLVTAKSDAKSLQRSPRQLFNQGLGHEERGERTEAIRAYLAAGLGSKSSFADELYAQGAGLRLVRLLAGEDDDAALAVAIGLAGEVDQEEPASPLLRSLLSRLNLERARWQHGKASIASVRYRTEDNLSLIELRKEGGKRQVVLAKGRISPFTAGDQIRVVLRKESKKALAGWRLVAMGYQSEPAWRLLGLSTP